MNQIFRKAMYFGFGALTMTREKAEKFFNEMVEKGEMNRDEARGFIDEAIKKGEEEQNEIRKMIKSEFEKFKADLPFVSRADMKNLEARIEELERKLNGE